MAPPYDPLAPLLAFLADPAVSDDARGAFWAVIAATAPPEAAADLRRRLKSHQSDGLDPPADLDPPLEPDPPLDHG